MPTIHVHFLSAAVDPEPLEGVLSPDELARARRYRFEADRRRSIVTRAAVRRLVGRAAGREGGAVEIVSGENGKPRLASGEVHFNATHSGDLVAVAVAGSEVGVDAELLRPMRDALAIGERFFSAAEVERLRAAADVDAEFFSIWTMKEAVVKGIGKGITAPLQSFTVPRDAHSLTPVASESELFRGWYVMALPAPGGYRAAVATRDGDARVEVLRAEG